MKGGGMAYRQRGISISGSIGKWRSMAASTIAASWHRQLLAAKYQRNGGSGESSWRRPAWRRRRQHKIWRNGMGGGSVSNGMARHGVKIAGGENIENRSGGGMCVACGGVTWRTGSSAWRHGSDGIMAA